MKFLTVSPIVTDPSPFVTLSLSIVSRKGTLLRSPSLLRKGDTQCDTLIGLRFVVSGFYRYPPVTNRKWELNFDLDCYNRDVGESDVPNL